MRQTIQNLLLTAVFLAVGAAADARIWQDATGRFRVEAELVAMKGDVVKLKKPNGEVISVPLGRLSPADREFLHRQPKATVAKPADEPDAPAAVVGRLGEVVPSRVTMGLKITGVRGTVSGLVSTIPVPAEWPEQELEIVDTQKTSQIRKLSYRDHPGGSRQMVVSIRSLRAGEEAVAKVTFLVKRRAILRPDDTSIYSIPKKTIRDVRDYLESTPGIEVKNSRIQQIANELAVGNPSGWELARKTFDWVCKNVKYSAGDLKGALWAAQYGEGDCEEYTSLFIALCRANKIPARAVWVPGHCYPEFYLEDQQGVGHWFPCDAVAGNLFGELPALKPILQKGDSFRVPELSGPQRYLGQTLAGKIGRGAAQPQLEMILEYE